MKTSFDIFISYRRETGYDTANSIHDRLTRMGYKVFMDYVNLQAGNFNEQLYRHIENCKDVIVVLSANSLERVENNDNWFQLEIAYALHQKKNIIPAIHQNFKFPEKLPPDIDALRNYQGVEVSQAFFNAYITKLKKSLTSKPHLTWRRIKNYILFVATPLVIATGVFLYSYIQNQVQLEQVCKEVASLMGTHLVRGNNLIGIIEAANQEWFKFHHQIIETENANDKQHLRQNFMTYLDFQKRLVNDISVDDFKLSFHHENILTKNEIKTEDIKASSSVFRSDESITLDYLNKIKNWASIPESGWANEIDSAMTFSGESSKESIRSNIYGYMEILITMPQAVEDSYIKISPFLDKYPAVDFKMTADKLEALIYKSNEKQNILMNKSALIVGNESMKVQELQNKLTEKEEHKKKVSKQYQDSLEQTVANKRKVVGKKQTNLNQKKLLLRQSL